MRYSALRAAKDGTTCSFRRLALLHRMASLLRNALSSSAHKRNVTWCEARCVKYIPCCWLQC